MLLLLQLGGTLQQVVVAAAGAVGAADLTVFALTLFDLFIWSLDLPLVLMLPQLVCMRV